MNFKYFQILILIFALYSCKDETVYRVESDFEEYVDRFVTEASLRNKTFDLRNEGLIVEFADLDEDIAGLCHYEHPVRIEIDKGYWEVIGNSAGADLMRENIIFHEMGHGILNRGHLNSILENGDWKSIMCGGEKVMSKSWNINYRGFRRTYYLNELFNERTSISDSMKTTFEIDTTGFKTKIMYNFDNEANSGWKLGTNVDYSISIDNSRLKFSSTINQSYYVIAKTNIDVQSDFIFSFDIECSSQKESDQFGMLFGAISTSDTVLNNAQIEYFTITKQQKMYIGNRSWYSYYTELTKTDVKSSTTNNLRVIKRNNIVYYYINNKYQYCNEMEVKNSGNYFGFILPANTSVLIDNFRIGISDAALIKSFISTSTTNDFRCIQVPETLKNLRNK